MLKVRAHTCYLGKTGYASHARSFFRELSKHVDLRVRNYTWDSDPNYLNDIDYRIIDTITLKDGEKDLDYSITKGLPNYPWTNTELSNFKQDIDIVLMDMNHYYFYEEYSEIYGGYNHFPVILKEKPGDYGYIINNCNWGCNNKYLHD